MAEAPCYESVSANKVEEARKAVQKKRKVCLKETVLSICFLNSHFIILVS